MSPAEARDRVERALDAGHRVTVEGRWVRVHGLEVVYTDTGRPVDWARAERVKIR